MLSELKRGNDTREQQNSQLLGLFKKLVDAELEKLKHKRSRMITPTDFSFIFFR